MQNVRLVDRNSIVSHFRNKKNPPFASNLDPLTFENLETREDWAESVPSSGILDEIMRMTLFFLLFLARARSRFLN